MATCARTAQDLRTLAVSVRADGRGPLVTRALDVTEPDLLESFVSHTAERFGGLDGVVACAGARGGAVWRTPRRPTGRPPGR
ncbi:SDR family NAD(P)-dependent oxidoreductase [Streptomyces sp. M19]